MLLVDSHINHLKWLNLKVHIAQPLIKIILNRILNVSVLHHMLKPIAKHHRSLELPLIDLHL